MTYIYTHTYYTYILYIYIHIHLINTSICSNKTRTSYPLAPPRIPWPAQSQSLTAPRVLDPSCRILGAGTLRRAGHGGMAPEKVGIPWEKPWNITASTGNSMEYGDYMVIIWHLNQFLGQSTGWVKTNSLVWDGMNGIIYVHQLRIVSFLQGI